MACSRSLVSALFLVLAAALGVGAAPVAPVLIQPERLEVFPPELQLSGNRRRAQLLVTGYFADATVRDLTGQASIESSAESIVLSLIHI